MRAVRLAFLFLVGGLPLAFAAAPGKVTLVSPASDEEVMSEDVPLTVTNATDLDSVVLNLHVEVWSDLLGNIAFTGSVTQTTGAETTLVVDDVAASLTDDLTYFWRARAVDTAGEMGAWTALRPFFYSPVNDAPVGGSIISPVDTESVNVLQPALLVHSPTDPDDVLLLVRFEVSTDVEFGSLDRMSPDLPAEPFATTWLVSPPLVDGQLYWWRTAVSDVVSTSLAGQALFRVNLGNDPPTLALVIAPQDGADITETSPTLIADGVFDPDADPFSYTFEIDRTPTFSSDEGQAAGGISAGDFGAFWTPPVALVENVTYWWRVYGEDAESSGDAALSTFRVNAVNDPPSAPLILDPAAGETLLDALTQVAFVPGADPEATAVSWEVTVLDGDDVIATASGADATSPVTLAVFDEPVGSGAYTVQVVVADALGLESAPSSVPVRVRGIPKSDPGACAVGAGSPVGGALGLAALAILASRRRFRR